MTKTWRKQCGVLGAFRVRNTDCRRLLRDMPGDVPPRKPGVGRTDPRHPSNLAPAEFEADLEKHIRILLNEAVDAQVADGPAVRG